MVNLSEIFLDGMMSSLVCGFKDMGWRKISAKDMGGGVNVGEM